MARLLQLVFAFAALALVANAVTASSASLTSANFAALPGAVFDASASTTADFTVWSALTSVVYGPGADNTTVYAYGLKYTSTLISTVVSRKLNATLLSNGTAATSGSATIGTDASASPATVTVSVAAPTTGLGTLGLAYVAAVSSCNQVFVTIYTGGSSTPVTKQVTSNTCVACASAADGKGFDYTLGNLFYENSTYYVSFTTATYTLAQSGTCSGVPTSATASITTAYASYLQGVGTSAGALTWTTASNIVASGTTAAVGVQCGPQNYTNSTNFYCTYKDGSSATANLKAVPVPTASGTAGSAITIATDSTATANSVTTTMVYTLAGFIYGQYQQGILINNLTSVGTTSYSNNLQIYNLTSGATATAGGTAISGITNTLSGGAYTGAGITYSLGYGILDQYQSATTNPTYSYEISSYFANSTVNVSKVAVGSTDVKAAGTWFVDANGALWFGVYTVDTANSNALVAGTLGKLIAQIYSAGNILASFFALLSVMIAAVFAF